MNNFLNIPEKFADYKNAKIAVLPIAFDKSVSWQKGAAKGPAAIISASQQVELYDIDTDSEVYKQGVFTAPAIKAQTPKAMLAAALKKVGTFLQDGKFVVTLGGDHSIALAPITAHHDYYKDFTVLHLDAHADMRDIYLGSKYSHGSIMARVKELGLDIVSVGIRSMDISEKHALPRANLFLAQDIFACANDQEWLTKVIKRLGEKVYLSLDVDVFDSDLMSATGTPEPGGLNWYQVVRLLKAVCAQRDLIGCDIVELAPCKINKAPDFLVAKLIYKLLSYKFAALPLKS